MKTLSKHSTKNISTHVLMLTLYILMFAYAISATIIGPLIPIFIERYSMSLAQSGLITSAQGAGGILVLFSGIFWVEKTSKPLLIKLTFILYIIAVVALTFSQIYPMLLFLFFVIGASTKSLDGSLNAYIADINTARLQKHLGLLHASFGLGALSGPLISSVFIKAGFSISNIFFALSLFCGLCFIFHVIVQQRVEITQRDRRIKMRFKDILSFFKDKNIVLLSIICLLYTEHSTGVSAWMPTLMIEHFNLDIKLSGLPVSLLWVGIVIARLVSSIISEKIDTKKVLVISSLIGAVIWLAAFLINLPYAMMIACFLTGLSVGAIVPVSVAWACKQYPEKTGIVTFIIFICVTAGYMIIPWQIGQIGDITNLWTSLLQCSVIILLISVMLMKVKDSRNVE